MPSIPPQPNPLTLKNTIVAGSTEGGACDAFVTSEGGNLASHHTCFISVPGSDLQLGGVRDRQGANPALDALADNGGATLTHAPRYGSFAIDGGVGPCPETDARLVSRPQNGRCDTGAFEFAGPPPPADEEPPDTQYISGPVQDSLETSAFFFTGTDNITPTDELIYECRLIEHDLTEAPEPQSPFEAIDPMFIWQSCSSGWQTELFEDGLYTFEVRAIDRAGREDPTPVEFTFNGLDINPPDTIIAEKPPLVTNSRAATFTFSGVDNGTPAPFLEYECRLDSRDPEMWLECFNPTFYSNLTSGQHTLEVRAIDGAEVYDPTPARYTWTVGVGTAPDGTSNCDTANVTLTPTADGWVDEVNPVENYLFDQELEVRSDATGNPEAVPPEPVVGQNARTLVRFPVPGDANDCVLESATLRLFADGMTEGRTLHAIPLAEPFRESTLTWASQPDTLNAGPAATSAGEGYREWDVKAHVEAMLESGVSHGWQIRDAHESDQENGGDQSFASRETPQDPPEISLPELKLRYVAEDTPPPDAAHDGSGHGGDRGALRRGADRGHDRRQRPRQLPGRGARGRRVEHRGRPERPPDRRAGLPDREHDRAGGRVPGRHPDQRAHQRDRPQRHGAPVRLGRAAELRRDPQRRGQRRQLRPRRRGHRALRRRRRPQRQHDPEQQDRRQRARRAARRGLREQRGPEQRDPRQPRRAGLHPQLGRAPHRGQHDARDPDRPEPRQRRRRAARGRFGQRAAEQHGPRHGRRGREHPHGIAPQPRRGRRPSTATGTPA